MVVRLIITACSLFLTLSGQTPHLKICVLNAETKEAIPNKEVTIKMDHTFSVSLTSDVDGFVKPILMDGGKYKIVIKVKGYEPVVFKKIKVDEVRGRLLVVKLRPVN